MGEATIASCPRGKLVLSLGCLVFGFLQRQVFRLLRGLLVGNCGCHHVGPTIVSISSLLLPLVIKDPSNAFKFSEITLFKGRKHCYADIVESE